MTIDARFGATAFVAPPATSFAADRRQRGSQRLKAQVIHTLAVN
jgi:hypothetical protein